MSTRTKIALFFVVIVFPALLSAVTFQLAFTRAESVEFCSSCHTMTPWVNDVTGKAGDSLAAEHFQHRWIQQDQCYTCHSNYGFLGTIQAKIGGVRHVAAYYFGHPAKIELYGQYPNSICLKCHEGAKFFIEDPNHTPLEDLLSGKDRCVECHESIHGVEQADDGEAAEAKAAGDEAKPASGEAKEDEGAGSGHDSDAHDSDPKEKAEP
ncbi:MAG TPA: NapC/NirT family cytochrome c [Candidatus Binatia bacterium]|jgi:hypothetical protein